MSGNKSQNVPAASSYPQQSTPSLNESTATSSQLNSKKRKKDDEHGYDQGNIHGDSQQNVQGNARPLSSEAWNHFTRKEINGVWKAICKYCNKSLSGHTRNGTTHLKNHTSICSRRSGKDIKQTLLNTKVASNGKVVIEKHSFDQKEARRELASMIILHEYPLSMVEHIGFRRFTSSLQPLFKPISRNTVKKDIIEIYDFEKAKTMSLLGASKSRIAITTDMWTSSNQKKGFMVVTSHFIDESWVLQNRIIRFAYIPHPHTAKQLCNELVDTLVDWDIDRNLSCVTVDNCSTNDLMLKLLEEKLSGEHLLLDGKFLHIRCGAHILNIIVKEGLDIIGEAIDKIRDSVMYWRATAKRIEEFVKQARKLKISATKKLICDCRTRWNSIYMMLDVALGYKEVFPNMKLKDKNYVCLPSENDWKIAQDICKKLKTFYELTAFFSGTAYPTANEFFSKVCQLKIELTKWLSEDDAIISSMANSMLEKFNKYWLEVNHVMAVASFLDPRYKLKMVEYFFGIIYAPLGDEEVKLAIKSVDDFCYALFTEYAKKRSVVNDKEAYTFSTTSGGDSNDPLSQYDEYVKEKQADAPTLVRSEYDKYKNEPVKPRTPDFDVLAWWKVNARDFPTLALIARDVLAIPVSTVASESAFSTSGRFVSPHRSRLHPNTLEALMCAQDWLWAQIKESCSDAHANCCTYYEDLEDEEEEVVVDLV